jgi:hypothetical protein
MRTWRRKRTDAHTCHARSPPEDYRWWWRAFFTSGSSALYLFLYSLFYFYTKLDIRKFVPMIMYFGESGDACVGGWVREGDYVTTQ